MTPSLALLLKDYRTNQATLRLLANIPFKEDDLIFADLDGQPFNLDTITPGFAKMAKRAGLRLRFHDLRHTHATLMLKSGVHPEDSLRTPRTCNSCFYSKHLYTCVVPGLQEAAARTFDENLTITNISPK